MEVVILVVHVIVALSIIGVILLQPPESGSLGGLGGSNPMAGMAGRGQAYLWTRTTAILATIFIITSLVLAILAGHKPVDKSILDMAAETPAVPEPVAEKAAEEPKAPTVPLSK